MFTSKVSWRKDSKDIVNGQSARENHGVKSCNGRALRLGQSHTRWDSAGIFGLGGWKLWAVIAVVIVAVVVISVVLLIGSVHPPVDVYSRAIPDDTALPEDLIPDTMCGQECVEWNSDAGSNYVDAWASYDGGVSISITRFDSKGYAQDYVDTGEYYYSQMSGSHTSVSSGSKQWFTHSGGGEDSVFVWRKGIWVFEIYAPNMDLVKEAAGEFQY